jgi:DNA-binding transcriptional regulator YiaG
MLTALKNLIKLLKPASRQDIKRIDEELKALKSKYRTPLVEVDLSEFSPRYNPNKLRNWRLKQNLTQKQLAANHNLAPSTISLWENPRANPTESSIKLLCFITGKRKSYFMGR